MAIGLVGRPGGGSGGVRWFGDKVKALVGREVDRRMVAAGEAVVARARQLAPVDTGKLRSSIYYMYHHDSKTLQLHADAPYAFFVEFGTRLMAPKPFLRPALLEFGKFWGKSELHFPEIRTPGTMPMPRANSEAIAQRDRINASLDKKFRFRRKPTTVIHGPTGRSLHGRAESRP